MAVGDLWQVTLRGTFLGEEVLNVFHYSEFSSLEASVDGTEIGTWFWDKFDTPLADLLSLQYTATQIDVLQIVGGVVIGSYTPSSGAGGQGGDPLPSYVAYGFRLNRSSSDSRHGYKRFPGVSESFVTGNTSSPPSGGVNGMKSALAASLTDPDSLLSGTLVPVILSRVVNGQTRPVPVGFPISSVVYQGVTTQNTRKP